MRFFYYYPTWDKPSGGNKQLRLQATLLRELGVETFLLRDEAYFARTEAFDDDRLYGVPIPIAAAPFERAQKLLHADDVIILPEVLLDRSLHRCRGWDVRIAVNNQNGFYSIQHSPSRCDARRLEFAIANAPYVADLCVRIYGIPRERVFLIPYWVDRPPFTPNDRRSTLAIGYMPRKLSEINRRVRAAVAQHHPEIQWVEIDGLAESEVAARLQQCRIFFSAQDQEGFGMPAIEAMACGAIVCGFAGTDPFPHPYALPGNGLWAKGRDVAGAIATALEAIEVCKSGGDRYMSLLVEGNAAVANFTCETSSQALIEMKASVERKLYARRGPSRVLNWRHERHILRLRYDHDKLGWPGRAASWIRQNTKWQRGGS